MAHDILGGVEAVRLSPVLAGRAEELKTLDAALARASAGEPQAFVVGGEAGVGKTRLVEEFLAAARRSGAVTAVGGCVELGADGLPFAPFTTALRALGRSVGGAGLAAAAAGREAELARLLPDLAQDRTADGGREAYEDSGNRLYELTAQLLERLAAEHTVVLALEDLHWADRSTRELLGFLFRSLQAARLVLLVTYRSDDVHRRHPLRPFLAELDRLRTVRRLELPRLSRDEVQVQLAGIRGGEPDPGLADAVFERSEGNPFFVEELAAGPAGGGLSESLRDLLLVRVEALPEAAQAVVRVAAEGGSHVEYALLEAVTGLPPDELLEALRTAVGANVLVPDEDGEAYRFRHALLREAVRDDLLPGERSRLNRRYAEALEADPTLVRPEQRLTRIARHWHYGRDAPKALTAKLWASVEARRRYAFAEQYELLQRALELWDDVPEEVRAHLRPVDHVESYPPSTSGGPLSELDLMAETMSAAVLAGERERALTLARRGLRMTDEAEEPLRAAWFLAQQARLLEKLGRGDGSAELDRAGKLASELPPSPVYAEILTHIAGMGMTYAPGAESLAAAERAVEVAALAGAEGIELRARGFRGVLRVITGDIEDGIAELRQVGELADRRGNHGESLLAESNLAAELHAVGRSAEAVEESLRTAERAAAQGRRESQAYAYDNLLVSLTALGRWDEAEQAGQQGRRAATTDPTRGTIALDLALLALLRGELGPAERELSLAREQIGVQGRQPQLAIQLHACEAGVLAGRGDFAAAREEAGQVLRAPVPEGMHRHAWPLCRAAAAVEAEAEARRVPGMAPGRAEALERIRATARALPQSSPVWAAHGRLVAAELARAEGRRAPELWAAAAGAFEAVERPYELALARLRWAEALLAAGGERDRAAGLLAEAYEVAVRLGAGPLRKDVERLAGRARIALRTHDGAPAPTDPAEVLGLTAREREVLRLVAVGHSNRQIALELFISPKTASVHVSNIMAKLGVSGRGEAAALAHRLRLFESA